MEYIPEIHTKDYLLDEDFTLPDLARTSPEFALSPLANDYEILSYVVDDDFGFTIAHILARSRPEWSLTPAAQQIEILSLIDFAGVPVAHRLAQYQASWCMTDAAHDDKILHLKGPDGYTVAHQLSNQKLWILSDTASRKEILKIRSDNNTCVAALIAKKHPEWMKTSSAHDLEILALSCNKGISVAHALTEHKECLEHEPLFNKKILSIFRYEGTDIPRKVFVPELIVRNHSEELGLTHSEMALKLISMGVAYQNSKPTSTEDLKKINENCLSLIDECPDLEICFKYAIAYYSTLVHISETFNSYNLISYQNLKDLINSSILGAEEILFDLANKNDFDRKEIDFDDSCTPAASL